MYRLTIFVLLSSCVVIDITEQVDPITNQEWDYLGCYPRVCLEFDHNVNTSHFLTSPNSCVADCIQLGFNIAAVYNWTKCSCACKISCLHPHPDDRYCGLPCRVDTTLSCGGFTAAAVYAENPLEPVPYKTDICKSPQEEPPAYAENDPKEWNYLGCYPQGCLEFDHNVNTPQFLTTPVSCASECIQLGFHIAAVYNRTKCSCACKMSCLQRTLDDAKCGLPCHINTSLSCGGFTAASVYAGNALGSSFDKSDVCKSPQEQPPVHAYADNDTKEWNYLGCFPHECLQFRHNVNTTQIPTSPYSCRSNCMQLGFHIAAFYNRTKCSCACKMSCLHRFSDDTYCGLPCQGDKKSTCSSFIAVSVYTVTALETIPDDSDSCKTPQEESSVYYTDDDTKGPTEDADGVFLAIPLFVPVGICLFMIAFGVTAYQLGRICTRTQVIITATTVRQRWHSNRKVDVDLESRSHQCRDPNMPQLHYYQPLIRRPVMDRGNKYDAEELDHVDVSCESNRQEDNGSLLTLNQGTERSRDSSRLQLSSTERTSHVDEGWRTSEILDYETFDT